MLRVNEIYGPTIQGEGPTMGRPCIFLRLAGCNLHCRWCDTPYTWNFEGTAFAHDFAAKVKREDEIHDMPVPDVVLELERLSAESGVNRLVISGGEPLLQQTELIELVGGLNGNWQIEIETNGTILPRYALAKHVAFNCSPKLHNSGNEEHLRRKIDALDSINCAGASIFKFVVSKEEDMDEVLLLIKEARIPKQRVFLMPLGHNNDLQEMNKQRVVELCIKHGFNFSPRLHIELWGTKRKV